MEIDPNAVIAALGQQVGALAADNARLRVGLDTAVHLVPGEVV